MDVTSIWYIGIGFLYVVGLLGLVCPEYLMRFSQSASKRFETSHSRIDKVHSIDSKIYRSHRVIGSVLLLLSLITLYLVLFVIADQQLIVRRSIEAGQFMRAWILETTLVIAVLSSIIGVCFGVVVLLRPSMLKPLEAWGNRWFRLPEEVLDKEMGQSFDAWVSRHTRLFGGLILFFATLIWFFMFGLD